VEYSAKVLSSSVLCADSLKSEASLYMGALCP
jgi:hypothetical protein